MAKGNGREVGDRERTGSNVYFMFVVHARTTDLVKIGVIFKHADLY